jgi:hypothetical protein
MRPTATFSVALMVGLIAFGADAAGQTPTTPKPAPPAAVAQPVDGTAFFHIGETVQALTYGNFYAAAGDKLAERYDKLAAECRRLGAPKEVLEDIDADRKLKLSMTFLKKPSADWTEAESKQFVEGKSLNLEQRWVKWLDQHDHEPRLFFCLGQDSLKGWYSCGLGVLRDGEKLTAYDVKLRQIVRNMSSVITSDFYAKARTKLTLTPEALAAVKAIADLSQSMEDPLGDGVTMTHLRTIDSNCKVLRDLARGNKLTVAPASK